MNKNVPQGTVPGKQAAGQPNELTAVAPEFSGRVTNRPTPEGADVEEFNLAEEAERQEDA